MVVSLASLLFQETKAALYARALQIAESVGLPVSTWQAGDPTRSDYHVLSEILALLEDVAVEFISAGLLDYAAARAKATGKSDWLKLKAEQDFGVEATEAQFATTTELFFNTGGALYTPAAGDVIVSNPSTGKTYRNTAAGTFSPASGATSFAPAAVNTSTNTIAASNSLANGDAVAFTSTGTLPGGLSTLPTFYYAVNRTTTSFQVSTTVGGSPFDITTQGTGTHKYHRATALAIRADEAGSDSNAAIGEINELVSTFTGVTCTNPTVVVATDEESPDEIVKRCRNKLSSLSPNGPPGGYEFVATTPELGGIAGLRVREFGESDTGDVTVYLADDSGGVSGDDRDQVEEAIVTWATPLTITPTVLAASNVTVNVTYQLWLYEGVSKTEQEIKDEVQDALEELFATRPIGGDIVSPATTGKLYKTLIESTIRGVFPDDAFRVSVSAPAGDTALNNNQVAVLGTVTPTITLETNP